MLVLGWRAIAPGEGHAQGRALLGALYERCVGQPMPEIIRLPGGKPVFRAGNIHFSISHTDRHVFCVLSTRPVGLDAEEADRPISLRLADKILSPAEYALWAEAADKREALLRLWVLKEAAAKRSGEGIRGYPNKTNFSPADPAVMPMAGCLVAVLEEGDDHAL